MATRRGGRKNVKKGVQFTVMVVGERPNPYHTPPYVSEHGL
jgi:septin family protein